MEKQEFLDRVRQGLLERGVAEATVVRQINRLSRFIDEEGGANAAALLDGEDPALLAEEIATTLRQNAARRAEAVRQMTEEIEPVAVAAPTTVQPTVQQARPMSVADAQTREVDIVHPSQTFDIVDVSTSTTTVSPAADFDETDLPAFGDDNIYLPPEEPMPASGRGQESGGLEIDRLRSRASEYAELKGGPVFWATFILALPFLGVLTLAVLALFVAAFAALVVLMIASIVALIAIAAAGTAFVLVALIYGIVQALSVLPIGLYEIGIGVMAGAIVLFVSILLYNFAIRLLPYAMKQLARFFGFTVRSLKALFIFVKGACAKL